MARNTQLAEKLYQARNETGDVTFIVDSQSIRAHRCVLAAFSPKYKAQLYDTELEKDNIEVDGVTAAAFNEFLRFFYFSKVNLTAENIAAVLDLVKQSLVDDFVMECVDFLKQTMTVENVCSVYRLANLYDVKELKDLCEQKIGNDAKRLFATEDFVHCDRETLTHILQMESLCCEEMEVFDACIAWARTACEQKNIDATKPENLRAELGDAIYQVRFGSMTIEEYIVRHKSLEGIFTPIESNEIFYMIGKLHDFKSNKFNQTQRKGKTETHTLLECKVPILESFARTHSGSDALIFSCNSDISLHGFAIDADVGDDELTVNIEIFSDPPTIMNNYSHSIKKSENETIVTFVEPINVIANEGVWLKHTSTNLKGRSVNVHDIRREVESNNILFKLRPIGMHYTSITRLLFTK